MLEPSTSDPAPKRVKLTNPKNILEALNADGSIDLNLLKKITRGCFLDLYKTHCKGKILGHFRPEHVFYQKVDGRVDIKFINVEAVEETEMSQLKWMAPEKLEANVMPDDRSDVFILGLLFFYLLTNKKSPMSISPTDFEEDQMKYRVRVSMKHLDDLQAGNDSDIYLIALIKKMIQKDPQDRLTSNKLINHAAFIDSIEQIQITQRLYKKCYYFVEADNEALVKLLNEEKKHIEASLGAKSTELVQLQTRALVMSDKKIIVDWKFYKKYEDQVSAYSEYYLKCFPHMQQIYQDQVARVKIRAFKEIFVHYDDEENLLGIHRWGSRFYKGEFKQRQIAIKRSLKTTMPVNEIWNLGKIDAHPNVVRYIAMEASADAFYVGLELCKFNLEQLITDVTLREARSQITIKSIMYQTTSGLSHLHELNIIHCNLRPKNVMFLMENDTYTIKLTDLCHAMDLNEVTVSNDHRLVTNAWMPLEVRTTGHTKPSDVYTLGCVLYYVISNRRTLSTNIYLKKEDIEAHHELIKPLMLNGESSLRKRFFELYYVMTILFLSPQDRPSAKELLKHCVFTETY